MHSQHRTAAAPTAKVIDEQFLDAMVPHHHVAVEMADAVLQKGKRDDVKHLAEKIKSSQEQQIKEMQQLAKEEYGFTPSTEWAFHAETGTLMGMPIILNLAEMKSEILKRPDPDEAFLRLMIPHHAIAVIQADSQIRNGSNPKVKKLCGKIVRSQSKQIGEMEKMLEGEG